MASEEKKITRREILIGAGAALAAGAAATACSAPVPVSIPTPAPTPDIVATAIPEPVPATDPDSPLWEKATAVELDLVGQVVVPPIRSTPLVPKVSVRALHDGKSIAFLLEWADAKKDQSTIKTEQFADACAVLLGSYPAPAELWFMGTPEMPVTILQWRSEWQLDIEQGFQDLEAAFPNVAFDYYPPLPAGSGAPIRVQDYPPEARPWLPGLYVGNILSQIDKPSPVQKLVARGAGTLEAMKVQDGVGRGVWRDGKWKVVLSKGLAAAEIGELSLSPGGFYSVAFALWAGDQQDRGGRKSITTLRILGIQTK